VKNRKQDKKRALPDEPVQYWGDIKRSIPFFDSEHFATDQSTSPFSHSKIPGIRFPGLHPIALTVSFVCGNFGM
jgi:hypothetical protein